MPNIPWKFFSKISIHTENMFFRKKFEKNSEKKCAPIFLKVGSKEHWTLNIKLAYVKPIFWSFSGQILTNNIFWLNSEKKSLKKIEKPRKFRKFFLWIWSEIDFVDIPKHPDLVHFDCLWVFIKIRHDHPGQLRGWSSHLKSFSMANCRKSTIVRPNITSL
jgi:hypothetical protein